MNVLGTEEPNHFNMPILARQVCTSLRAAASLFMQCLHHKQVPSLCCVVCLPLSHGFARNQGQGNSTVPDIVSLLAEYIHNLLLQQQKLHAFASAKLDAEHAMTELIQAEA